MAKGDSIQVQLRGVVGSLATIAQKSGREVNYDWDQDGKVQWLVVKETTRGGTTIQESRYAAVDVLVIHLVKKDILK